MPLFEILSNRSMLDNKKCPFNNIKHFGPVEIHNMQKLSQLNKDVPQIDEIICMFNRQQISLCKLNHKKYFGLSLIKRINSLCFIHSRQLKWFELIANSVIIYNLW